MISRSHAHGFGAVAVIVAVGAAALSLKLEGAALESAPGIKASISRATVAASAEAGRSEARRIKLGRIPDSLPIMPVVTVDPRDDPPSRLRAAGLLKGPMPLREPVVGIASGGCTFDVECEDGDPCTEDFCDIGVGAAFGTGVCNNEVVPNDDPGEHDGDDCSDGLACNGLETCQGATVFSCTGLCVGGDNDGTCGLCDDGETPCPNGHADCVGVSPLETCEAKCAGGAQDLQACSNGDIDCKTPCIRESDCPGGGTCASQVCHGYCLDGDRGGEACNELADCPGGTSCVTNAKTGAGCVDNSECGSAVGICQLPGFGNDPIVCDPDDVCDERLDPVAACVPKCANGGDCDDGLTCTGIETCDTGTGLCSSSGNPCGSATARCREKVCLSGTSVDASGRTIFLVGRSCETFNDCDPSDTTSCGDAGPYCAPGRCCVGTTRKIPNWTKDKRCRSGVDVFQACNTDNDCTGALALCSGCDEGVWYPGDAGQLDMTEVAWCPPYSSGIGDAGPYLVAVGPASLSALPYELTDAPLRKLGDDYDTGQSQFVNLQYLRFAGGVRTELNGRIAFEFYDEDGNFVEDVFFPSSSGAYQIQVVELAGGLLIPPRGFIVGHVLQSYAYSTEARGEFFWLSTTDPPDAGLNDPYILYVDTDLDGAPAPVINFLGVCNGGDRDGLACDPDGDQQPDCPGGSCESVPGVLAFELEGDLTTEGPYGGCCNPDTFDCNEMLAWTCDGSYLGDDVPCAQCSDDSPNVAGACRTCSIAGTACSGVADCPPGETCDLNDSLCGLCDDFSTPCTVDQDCIDAGTPEGLCFPGTCEFNAACMTGACCIPTTGECLEAHTVDSCAALAGNFQGLGTDCDPDCCAQPIESYTGADNCEDAIVSVIQVPATAVCVSGENKGVSCFSSNDCQGATCARTVVKTITGDNSTASNTFENPDSCSWSWNSPLDDLGWYEAIQIYDPAVGPGDTIACAYVMLDYCCSDPVREPSYVELLTSCYCDNAILVAENPNHAYKAAARGGPFCLQDNIWMQFGPLIGARDATELAAGVGTYYHPVLSRIGANLGPYQFHVRVEACPDAVCCVGVECKLVNILECADLGGYFLAPPNRSTAVTFCSNQCSTGSCCTDPGVCIDNKIPGEPPASFDPMDAGYCTGTLLGTYVGGARCFGGVCQGGVQQGQSCRSDDDCDGGVCQGEAIELAQPLPCPICDIRGPNNCQAFDDPEQQQPRFSELSMWPTSMHVADDFKPHGTTISRLCVWGTYGERNDDPTKCPTDCADTVDDGFRIRVYASDELGLPDVNNIVGEANPSSEQVVRTHVPETWLESACAPGGRVWGYTIDLGAEAITGLDPSGNTCYWLEVVNDLDGSCAWSWMTVDAIPGERNDYSAVGSGGVYGPTSPRYVDMAFCLDVDFVPAGCGTPVGYCCDCDGVCSMKTRRECLESGGRWRLEDTCDTHACEDGAPDNDKCLNVVADTFPETLEGAVRLDNTCSNADGVNPVYTEVFQTETRNIAADVWYKYVATCDGLVTFSTCPTGAAEGGGLDSVMVAYKDPVDPTECVCPGSAEAQDAAVAWYLEPTSLTSTIHAADENCDGVRDGGGGYIVGEASVGDCFMIRVGGYAGDSEEGQGTLTIECNVRPAPEPLSPVDGGNRYIRVEAPPSGGLPGEEAIRVRFVSLDGFPLPSPDFLYVGAPFDAPEEDQTAPGATFVAAPLSCDPYFRDWSTLGIIAIYGSEIVPGSEYVLQRANDSCTDLADELCWSDPVVITTAKYGDVWPLFEDPANPPQPDFSDIAAVVQKFLATGPATAPIKAMAQLQPNCVFPDRAIDFRDVAADVEAFLGTPYASVYRGPCTCPSTITCGATPCTTDLQCGDGLCLNDFCTDPCARCTP